VVATACGETRAPPAAALEATGHASDRAGPPAIQVLPIRGSCSTCRQWLPARGRCWRPARRGLQHAPSCQGSAGFALAVGMTG